MRLEEETAADAVRIGLLELLLILGQLIEEAFVRHNAGTDVLHVAKCSVHVPALRRHKERQHYGRAPRYPRLTMNQHSFLPHVHRVRDEPIRRVEMHAYIRLRRIIHRDLAIVDIAGKLGEGGLGANANHVLDPELAHFFKTDGGELGADPESCVDLVWRNVEIVSGMVGVVKDALAAGAVRLAAGHLDAADTAEALVDLVHHHFYPATGGHAALTDEVEKDIILGE